MDKEVKAAAPVRSVAVKEIVAKKAQEIADAKNDAYYF